MMDRVQKLLVKICKEVATPTSREVSDFAQAGEWAKLLQLRLKDPGCYPSAIEYKKDALVIELLRKCRLPGDSQSRYDNAVKTFWASEADCLRTNGRLRRFISGQGPFTGCDLEISGFINQWRETVRRFLGRVPSHLEPVYTAGSTLSDQGCLTTIPDKMSSQQTAYTAVADLAHLFEDTELVVKPRLPASIDVPGPLPRVERLWSYVRGNRFFTVPKDSEKDRGCCVEASVAIALQRAIGMHLVQRFRTVYQVDLKQAKPDHMLMAQAGSIHGRYATIDLSNASDTMAKDLVRLILPGGWWELLNSLRAPFTELDGRQVWLEKFSSMGNGFTFELETMLFWTLCETLGCEIVRVFGDDIIVDTGHAPAVIAALRFFGFTPNKRKTFCEGPFRESCGGDFFEGTPVRAHYLEELPDEPQKWVGLANGLRRVDPDQLFTRSAWRFCIDQIPTDWRNYGPCSLGDLVLFDPEAIPSLRRLQHKGAGPELVPHWRVKRPLATSYQVDKYWSPEVAFFSALKGVGERVTPRRLNAVGFKTDYVIAWGVAHEDPYNGPLAEFF